MVRIVFSGNIYMAYHEAYPGGGATSCTLISDGILPAKESREADSRAIKSRKTGQQAATVI